MFRRLYCRAGVGGASASPFWYCATTARPSVCIRVDLFTPAYEILGMAFWGVFVAWSPRDHAGARQRLLRAVIDRRFAGHQRTSSICGRKPSPTLPCRTGRSVPLLAQAFESLPGRTECSVLPPLPALPMLPCGTLTQRDSPPLTTPPTRKLRVRLLRALIILLEPSPAGTLLPSSGTLLHARRGPLR